MRPGSLSTVELARLRLDQTEEIGDGTQGKFYRFSGTSGEFTITAGGTVVPSTESVIYEGPVEFSTIEARRDRYETRVGEHVYLKQYRVSIPASTLTVPQENDRYVTTSSHADPNLVGKVMIVKDVEHDSELSKRRITVIDENE